MILERENIFLNETPDTKENIIKRIGDIFSSRGMTDGAYTQAMLDKEKEFNTNIGNGIAIPHGIESAKKYIIKTGLVLMTFPEGQEWGSDEKVKVVIGIAAVGDEHLDLLSKIALTLSEPEEVDRLMEMDADGICELFK